MIYGGKRVRVADGKHEARLGTVERLNPCSVEGCLLWYVRLDPKGKLRTVTECFWESQLEEVASE